MKKYIWQEWTYVLLLNFNLFTCQWNKKEEKQNENEIGCRWLISIQNVMKKISSIQSTYIFLNSPFYHGGADQE